MPICHPELRSLIEPPFSRWLRTRGEAARIMRNVLSTVGENTVPKGILERVLVPNGLIAERMAESLVTDEKLSAEEEEAVLELKSRLAGPGLCAWISAVWGLERVVVAYPPREAGIFVSGDWWRDYKTDYIIDRFEPWMLYVSLAGFEDADGKRGLYEGMYAGFDFLKTGLHLFALHMTQDGLFDPFYLHEYPFERGMTLGEVVDNYTYRSPYSDFVMTSLRRELPDAENLTELMTEPGKAFARCLLPLLVGVVGDDCERKRLKVDMKSFELTESEGSSPLPKRKLDADPFEEGAQDACADVYIVRQLRRDGAADC